uniref:Uncharacterized protein n=1 Tax=Suricata suricatta TaxID=37032 RepID=A0A673TW00_SURSU
MSFQHRQCKQPCQPPAMSPPKCPEPGSALKHLAPCLLPQCPWSRLPPECPELWLLPAYTTEAPEGVTHQQCPPPKGPPTQRPLQPCKEQCPAV